MFVSDLEMTLTSPLSKTNFPYSNLLRKSVRFIQSFVWPIFLKNINHKEMKQFFTPNFKTVLVLVVLTFNAAISFAGTNNENPANGIQVTKTANSLNFKWVTAPTANFNYYEVERSADNVTFKTVGMVLDGFDTVEGQKSFMFKESNTAVKGMKVAYYRLKQMNTDGTASYSEVVKVAL